MSPFVVVFAVLCAGASAQVYHPYATGYDHYDYNNGPASYSFSYDVQEPLTGDFKSQAETRNGDVVQGHYSLVEADGTRRIVEYTADDVNGFNAVVHKEGEGSVAHGYAAGAPAAVAAPVAVAAKAAYQPAMKYAYPAYPNYAAAGRYYQPSYAPRVFAQPAFQKYAHPAAFPAYRYY